VSEGITVDCRTLDYSVEPCVEGDRSNGKTADFGQWCGAMRRGRKVDAEGPAQEAGSVIENQNVSEQHQASQSYGDTVVKASKEQDRCVETFGTA